MRVPRTVVIGPLSVVMLDIDYLSCSIYPGILATRVDGVSKLGIQS